MICGCTKHELTGEVIRMSGKTWTFPCAIRKLLSELASKKKENQKLLENIGEVRCPYCNAPVGKNFAFHESTIICMDCLFQMSSPF